MLVLHDADQGFLPGKFYECQQHWVELSLFLNLQTILKDCSFIYVSAFLEISHFCMTFVLADRD